MLQNENGDLADAFLPIKEDIQSSINSLIDKHNCVSIREICILLIHEATKLAATQTNFDFST